MNILLLGSGGREHAFAWKMTESELCSELYIAPGNAGTHELGINLDLNPNDFDAVKEAVLAHGIEMVVVGPEEPLVRGIYDFFQKDADLEGVAVVGPSQEGAKLEGSKAYAKVFMQENNIPTAAYREFTAATLEAGKAYLATQTPPFVLKADGLAAGKGVLILDEVTQAQAALEEMLGGKFGAASATVVVEAFLKGIEFSVFVLTDGKTYKILPVAKDYKRIGEGDTGLNTGGMGAISPPSFVSAAMMQKVEERIIKPTIAGLQQRQIVYKGFIFFGLIAVNGEPFVIEYNCRMGDPETEAVLPRLKGDLVELLYAAANDDLEKESLSIDPQTTATVMLVAGGYPESYEKGKEMKGLEKLKNCWAFHAGTTMAEEKVVTNGGRVLAITARGKNMKDALATAYKNAKIVDFEGKYYRKDIGFDL
jgi:phosphoribosylamine---glycine ligase